MEEWRDVPGFEGKYQISIDTPEGRCRSLKNNKELSNTPNKREGRVYWGLCNNAGVKVWQSARWIALTYPELVQNEYFEGAEIDHIIPLRDGGTNHPSNLRWVTGKENCNNPLTKKHQIEAAKKRKHTDEEKKKISESRRKNPYGNKWVIQLSLKDEILHFYRSINEAARETGTNRAGITACCQNKELKDGRGYTFMPQTAGGYKWKYAE